MILQCYFGSCLMSFLLCVSRYRLHHWKQLFSRSKCNHCFKTLRWWMLIPIMSFILLKGRCFYCHYQIPRFLWVGECLGAFTSFLIFTHAFQIETMYFYLLSFILLTMSFIDVQSYIVQHRLLLLLLVMVAIMRPGQFHFSLLTCLCISILLVIGIVFHHFIGFGDIKLLMILFTILPVPFVLYTIWFTFPLAYLCYPFYAPFLSDKHYIPLVPFITLSFFIVAYCYPLLNVWLGGVI